MRKVIFANGEYYHVYNRGVDKRDVFLDENDHMRFLKNLREFNNNLIREERLRMQNDLKSEFDSDTESNSEKQFVEIIAYCLNPNHYHLILKQNLEKGIEKFMQKIGTGYTNYFNKKYERSGALFQGKFKAIHIDSNEYLLYLSAYVNRNNFIHGYGNNSKEWKYCSAPDYLVKRNGTLCNKDVILDQFKEKEYEDFLDKNAQHLKENKELARYCIEE
jgi:putative transposase